MIFANFLTQIMTQVENPYTDKIVSIGTVCGFETDTRYIVHMERADGTQYEIPVKEEN